jgi:hypothetical protein
MSKNRFFAIYYPSVSIGFPSSFEHFTVQVKRGYDFSQLDTDMGIFTYIFLRKNTYIYPPKRGQVLEDI